MTFRPIALLVVVVAVAFGCSDDDDGADSAPSSQPSISTQDREPLDYICVTYEAIIEATPERQRSSLTFEAMIQADEWNGPQTGMVAGFAYGYMTSGGYEGKHHEPIRYLVERWIATDPEIASGQKAETGSEPTVPSHEPLDEARALDQLIEANLTNGELVC